MIQLTKRLVLTADKNCYVLGEVKQRPGRAAEIKGARYYTTAAQAVQGALDTTMRWAVENGSIATLQEFIREQERQRAKLEELIAPLDSGGAAQERGEGRLAVRAGNNTLEAKMACTPAVR